MKICLLADAGSVHVRQLSLHLSHRGHQVHVVSHKLKTVPGASVEKFAVPPPGLLNPRRWANRRRRYLLNIFRKFDVVNVHFLADWSLAEVLADRRNADSRLVASAWGSDIVDPPGEAPAGGELTAARIGLVKAADAVTAWGPAFARSVADYAGISLEFVHAVPLGVDISGFAPRASERAGDGTVRVGFFKGFRPVYGATTFVRAMPAILADCPNVRFEMIGDGAELQKCQRMALELGVDHAADWVGRLDHNLLPARIGSWQLSVVPSIHEAFGVAALESQAMGVPVVASCVDGLQDTVRDGETGLLFPVGDAKALAGKVVRLLRDSTLRRKMGVAGREMVGRMYDWPDVAGQWASLYGRVREQACVMV